LAWKAGAAATDSVDGFISGPSRISHVSTGDVVDGAGVSSSGKVWKCMVNDNMIIVERDVRAHAYRIIVALVGTTKRNVLKEERECEWNAAISSGIDR
jgi:hypothetical protein